MIEIAELTKSFGNFKALDCVSLSIADGESVCLLGENGAGKSTLIKCILGMLEYSGQIKLNSIIIEPGSTEHRFDIGYIPQEPVFYDMKVDELISFFGILRRVGNDKINESLKIAGLLEHRNKHTSELSGGLKQRLSFAIALISDPSVLILDEPTSNLDASARLELMKLVKKLKETGKTVLFSSHRMDEVQFLADRVYLLKKGRVIKQSAENELTRQLGLKTKIIVNVNVTDNQRTIEILKNSGFNHISKNGAGILVSIDNDDKTEALKKILDSGIAINDINIEAPSMDEIMRSV
ncbi:MAG TPA: ABC transporter ATP-binding protein [Thermodesulfobacteriota bacterium]|nr:ABC transporter ATP-binding protein [Thermodesulfobacteriota bacterium]